MQWLLLQLALRARRGRLRRRWARMGNGVDDGRCRTNKGPKNQRALVFVRLAQQTNLPHRLLMQWLLLQLALRARRGRLRRRWARMGNGVDDGRCRTNKRPDESSGLGVRLTAATTYSPTPVAHAVASFTARAAREAGAAAPPMDANGQLRG